MTAKEKQDLIKRIRAIPLDKPHHHYSHWEDKHPGEVVEDVVRVIEQF